MEADIQVKLLFLSFFLPLSFTHTQDTYMHTNACRSWSSITSQNLIPAPWPHLPQTTSALSFKGHNLLLNSMKEKVPLQRGKSPFATSVNQRIYHWGGKSRLCKKLGTLSSMREKGNFKCWRRKHGHLPKKASSNALQGFVPIWPTSLTKPKFQAANRAGQIANKAHSPRHPLSLGNWDNDKATYHVHHVPGIPTGSGMYYMDTKVSQWLITSKPHHLPHPDQPALSQMLKQVMKQSPPYYIWEPKYCCFI